MSISSKMMNTSQYIQRVEYYIAMFLKTSECQNHLEGLLNHKWQCPTSKVYDLTGQSKGSRIASEIFTSNSFL